MSGTAKTEKFLDDIKELGYQMAFRGGLSFNLDHRFNQHFPKAAYDYNNSISVT